MLKGSAYWTYRRQQRFCSMLMRDDFLLLFPKMPQVRIIHGWLCSDLACVYDNQNTCIVVLHDNQQAWQFSLSYFCRQYTVTNLILAICNACTACVLWSDTSLVKLHSSSMPQCIACSHLPHNVLHPHSVHGCDPIWGTYHTPNHTRAVLDLLDTLTTCT